MITLSDHISNEIKFLEPKLVEYIKTPNEPINDILTHIFASGGKRIRPTIFLLCSKLINYNSDDIKFQIAAVCEYIHTASLLHDDVIDNSTLRRNKPTANSIWGDETAVLAGDLIYSTACRLMVKSKNFELIDTFAECIRFMSECELYQLEVLWKSDIQESEYDHLISGKTALLFEASAKTPGYLKNSPPDIIELLSNFGKNIGMAFQIADDCLDYSSTEDRAGKPVSVDVLEGKVTLPLIYALQQNNPILKEILDNILESGTATDTEKQNLKKLVLDCGGLEKAQQRAKNHIAEAMQSVETISKKLNSTSESIHILSDLKLISSLII